MPTPGNKHPEKPASSLRAREAQRRRRKLTVEGLESRIAPAATPLKVDLESIAPNVAHDVRLKVASVGGTPQLQVVDASNAIMAARNLVDVSSVAVVGGGRNDTLTVDFSQPFSVPVTFDGGPDSGGVDSLVIQGGTLNSAQFTADVPGGGSVALTAGANTAVVGYSRIETVTDATGGAKVFAGTEDPDQITARDIGASNDGAFGVDVEGSNTITFTNAAAITSLTINTGAGSDGLTINALDDRFNGALSVDVGGGDDDVTLGPKTGGGTFTLNGGPGADLLRTTRDANITLIDSQLRVGGDQFGIGGFEAASLTGGDSANRIDASGFTGNVTLRGGVGDDLLVGGSGNDFLEGGVGDDVLVGGPGDDLYRFNVQHGAILGTDIITEPTSGGTDTLDFRDSRVGLNIDLTRTDAQPVAFGAESLAIRLTDPSALENVQGGSGNDVIIGNDRDNLLAGRGGNDRVDGGAGNDTVNGDAGDDVLTGGPGADSISGGTNFDTLTETRDADMTLSDASLVIAGETDVLSEIERAVLTGGAGANAINASAFSFDVTLNGLDGNDLLTGGKGNDVFTGGPGDDVMAGGLGNDRYVFDADDPLGSDRVVESLDAGRDQLDFSQTATPVNVDLGTRDPQTINANLTLSLNSVGVIDNVIGGSGSDNLIGNLLGNTIEGGPGDDTVFGGGGQDTFVFSTGGGNDVASDSAENHRYNLTDNSDDFVLENVDGQSRQMRLRDLNTLFPSPDQLIDASGRVEIDTGLGPDRVKVASLNPEFPGPLVISAGDDLIVDSAMNSAGRDLELRAGETVQIAADVSTGGGRLTIDAGKSVDVGIRYLSNNPSLWLPGHAYHALSAKATSGAGVGMLVDVEVNTSGDVTASIVDPGTGYKTGDTVTIEDPRSGLKGSELVLFLTDVRPATLSTRNLSLTSGASIGSSGAVQISATHILLADGSKLLADVVGPTAARAGDVLLDVNEVAGFDVQGFANVDASMVGVHLSGAELRGGDVEVRALANNTRLFFDEDTMSLGEFALETFTSIVEGLLDIIGGVSISRATAAVTVDKDSSIVATSLDVNASAQTYAASAPIGLEVGIAIGIAESTSIVDVAGKVTTAGDTTLQARNDNTRDVRGEGSGLVEFGGGFAVSVLNSTAAVNVEESAELNVGGNLFIQADDFDRNYTIARSTSGNDGAIGVAVAVSVEKADVSARLDGTADVGGDVVVNSLHQTGTVQARRLGVPTVFSGVHAAAGVNTDGSGDFLDDTQSALVGNVLLAKLKSSVIHRAIDKLKLKVKGENGLEPTEQLPFDVGAGMAVVVTNNNVEARIGDGVNRSNAAGDDAVNAGGSITVRALSVDVPDLSAKSLMQAPPKHAGPRDSTPNNTKFGGSVAIAVGNYHDVARAYVNDGAVVNASGDLTVRSETSNEIVSRLRDIFALSPVPTFKSTDGPKILHVGDIVEVEDGHKAGGDPAHWYRYRGIDGVTVDLGKENFADLNRWDLIGLNLSAEIQNVIADAANVFRTSLGVEKLFNTWSQATASSNKVAVAGAATVLTVDHDARAFIGKGADVNQDPSFQVDPSRQHVDVEASSTDQAVHFGGNVALPGFKPGVENYTVDITKPGAGALAADGSVGASFLLQFNNNAVNSEILDSARVFAGSLKVGAKNEVINLTVSGSGANAGKAGFAGSFAYDQITNQTLARIDDGAVVKVGSVPVPDGGGASLIVDARDRTIAADLVGAVGVGASFGMGASIGINNISRDTRALIGNRLDFPSDANSATGSLVVGGAAQVSALNEGFIATLALAGAAAKDSRLDPLGDSTGDGLSLNSSVFEGAKAKAGVGVAGDAAVNVLNERAQAFVNDMEIFSAQALQIHATSDTIVALLAGAASASVSGSSTSVGLAGSFSSNAVVSTTEAFLSKTINANVGALTIQADQKDRVVSITAGGSGAPRTNGVAVAGSVSVNVVLNQTRAFVADSTLTVTGDARVLAHDESTIWAGAGALAFGGKAGVGVSLALNLIGASNQTNLVPSGPGLTQAFIVGSSLTVTGGVLEVSASSADPAGLPRIMSVAASVGASVSGQGNLGGAGTVSLNIIRTTTEAFILGSVVSTPASAAVTAHDGSGIAAVSGAVGVSQKTSFGAALGYNDIGATTRAYLNDTDLRTTGTLDVRADSTSLIGGAVVGVAAGIGGGSKLAVAGSASANLIANTIDARISDTVTAPNAVGLSDISAGGTIRVAAVDDSTIVGITGGAVGSAKGVALGAAVGYNLIQNRIRASIEDANVAATGPVSSILVTADSDATLVSVALGIGAAAGQFALGGSVAVNSIADTLDAHIANSANISAGSDVVVKARATDTLISVAGGFAAANDAAVGAAVAYTYVGGSFDLANPNLVNRNSTATSQIAAFIDNAAVTSGRNIVVDAGYSPAAGNAPKAFDVFNATVTLPDAINARIITVTVGGAGAENFALGGSLSAQVTAHDVAARITGARPIRAGADVAVAAADRLELASAAGGIAGGKVAVGAIVSTQITRNRVDASVGSGADVVANGNVLVRSDRDTHVVPVAAALGAAGQAGIGGAILALVQRDSTNASIGADATVTALGSSSPVNFPGDGRGSDGRRAARSTQGVLVGATTFTDVFGVAVAGGLAGNAGLAGSGLGTDVVTTTSAVIGERAKINQAAPGLVPSAAHTQNVRVFAADDTRVVSAAGAIGASGTVGLGVGTDVELISKTTRAAISPVARVNADADVSVEAYSSEDLFSITGAAAGAGKVAIAGSVGVYKLSLNTLAEIGQSAVVSADENVVVAADDVTKLIQASGGVSGALVGVGASAAVTIVDKQTQARVGDFAEVDGRGLRGDEQVPTGALTESFAARTADDPVKVPAINQSSASDRSLKDARTASAIRASLKGVAVYATSFDQHTLVGVSAGGGAFDLRGVGVVESAAVTTTAQVGGNAKINADRARAGAEQSASIVAAADFQHLGIGGTLSGGGAALTPGAEVLILKMNTTAQTGALSSVSATRDVNVAATAHEDLASITTTAAGGGGALAGAASAITLTNATLASLGNASTTTAGNVAVRATDESDVDIIAGSAAIGLGSGGIGGSVSVLNVRKTTNAQIGNAATVDATGFSPTRISALADDVKADASGNPVVASQQTAGLVVQAVSQEAVLSIAASGAGGAFGGLAGAVTFANFDADTFATIGADAQINQNAAGGTDQSVRVAALDRVQTLAIAGALAGGSIGGLAGGVDVGLIHNDTAARIGDRAQVKAQKDASVVGLSGTQIQSFAASAAAGSVGLAGAVSVYNLGGNLGADGANSLKAANGKTTSGYIDSSASSAPMLGNFGDATDDADRPGNSTLNDASARLSADMPQSVGSAALARVGTPSGTSATIGADAVVNAGGTIEAAADSLLGVRQVAGAGQASLAGFGGSVVVLESNAPLNAAVQPSAKLTAGKDVLVHAFGDQTLGGEAYVGSFGGLVGLGAQVVIIHDGSTQAATLGTGVNVTDAVRLEVAASINDATTAKAIGGSAGLLTGGASIARITADGSTLATVGDGAVLGRRTAANAPATLGSLNIAATQTRRDFSTANTVTAAGAGAAGSEARVTATPTITASLGVSNRVLTSGDVNITAKGSLSENAESLGAAVGLVTVGLSLARTESSAKLTAEVGQGDVLDVGGNMSVHADYNGAADMTNDTPVGEGAFAKGVAGSGALAAGSGAQVDVVHRPEIRAALRDNAFVHTVGSLDVSTNLRSKAIADGLGGAIGVIGVGVVNSSVDDTPISFVNLHAGTQVRADANLNFSAVYRGRVLATSTAAAGGIVSGSGATSSSKSSPFVHVNRLGTSNVLDPGQASFLVGGDADVISQANGISRATTKGVAAGGVSVGTSDARAEWSPSVDSTLIGGTSLVGGLFGRGDVRVLALVNQETNGTTFLGGAFANATASAGAALVGGAGATATSVTTPRTSIGFGPGVIVRSSVSTPGDVTILASSGGTSEAITSADTFGLLVGAGSTTSTATSNPSTGIAMGAGVRVTATGDLSVISSEGNSAAANTSNAGKGFAGVAITTADALTTPDNRVNIRDGSQIVGGTSTTIRALSTGTAGALSSADGRGFGAGAQTTSSAVLAKPGTTRAALDANPGLLNTSSAVNLVEISPTVLVSGGKVTLSSVNEGTTATSRANSTVGGAITNADALTRAYRLTDTQLIVRAGARVEGPTGLVRLEALDNSPRAVSRAVASTDVQVGGDSDVDALNALVAKGVVTAEAGTSILAGNLEVVGADQPAGASPRIIFDSLAQRLVKGIDFGSTISTRRGSLTYGTTFASAVTLSGGFNSSPEVIIAADGSVAKASGFTVVNFFNSGIPLIRGNFSTTTTPARITVDAPTMIGLSTLPVLLGQPTINTTGIFFDQARITNNSTRTLILGDMTFPRSLGLDSLISTSIPGGTAFVPRLISGANTIGSKLIVDNLSGSAVQLLGVVDNSPGTIEINNLNGAVLQGSGTLKARAVTINAASIGQSTSRLSISLNPETLGVGKLLGGTTGDAFLSVFTASSTADNPQASMTFNAGGVLDVSIVDGTRFVNAANVVAPTTFSLLGTSAGRGLSVAGNLANLLLSDVTVSSGLALVFTNQGTLKGLGTATALRGAPSDLRAGLGVGPITTQIPALEADGGNAGISLRNQGDLRLGGVSVLNGVVAPSAIDIGAFGELRVQEPVKGAIVTLSSFDLATPGQNLVVFAPVQSTFGAVTLNAADDLILTPQNGTVAATSPNSISLAADASNADPGVGSTILVRGALDAPSVGINGGADDDILRLQSPWSSVAGRTVFFNGQGGNNTVVGPDVNTSWTINTTNGGSLSAGFPTGTNVLAFSNAQNLTGGAANDKFIMSGFGSVTGKIDGGGGTNSIGYTQYRQGVVVNLRQQSATGLNRGFAGIHDVTGSPFADLLIGGPGDDFLDGVAGDDLIFGNGGNDVLVGGDGNDVLNGGPGRDILLGGRGADRLVGGDQSDLLIAGLTVYDAAVTPDGRTDRAGVERLRGVWLQPRLSFDARVATLANSGLLNESSLRPDSTAGDILVGGSGRDWLVGREARKPGRTAEDAADFTSSARVPSGPLRTFAAAKTTRPAQFGLLTRPAQVTDGQGPR